jgi:hypothetical protein
MALRGTHDGMKIKGMDVSERPLPGIFMTTEGIVFSRSLVGRADFSWPHQGTAPRLR